MFIGEFLYFGLSGAGVFLLSFYIRGGDVLIVLLLNSDEYLVAGLAELHFFSIFSLLFCLLMCQR